MRVVFWQRMFSPHMMGLAESLAARGNEVVFVATEHLSEKRLAQGWQVPAKGKVERRIVNSSAEAQSFLAGLHPSTIHITQGLRGNAEIGDFQDLILASQQRLWVIMETVDLNGWRGRLKTALYTWEIYRRQKGIEGILAIGAGTAEWLVARGFPRKKVFPFAYFISLDKSQTPVRRTLPGGPFTFAYVGNFESWKNPMLALEAFIGLQSGTRKFIFVGDGSLYSKLKSRAQDAPQEAHIEFVGRLPMTEVPELMARIDCLVLPSDVDGWGVVASEAMLIGTPVVVSDACGVRAAVEAAPQGSVFPSGDLAKLQAAMINAQSEKHSIEQREVLRDWAAPLGSNFGGKYLEGILSGSIRKPVPDWLCGERVAL